jgi:uncharacterized protein
VHVSALANRFVKDPHEVVKPGQIVTVKVLDVDIARQRVSLTMRLDDPTPDRTGLGSARMVPQVGAAPSSRDRRPSESSQAPVRQSQPGGAFALALARAAKLKK